MLDPELRYLSSSDESTKPDKLEHLRPNFRVSPALEDFLRKLEEPEAPEPQTLQILFRNMDQFWDNYESVWKGTWYTLMGAFTLITVITAVTEFSVGETLFTFFGSLSFIMIAATIILVVYCYKLPGRTYRQALNKLAKKEYTTRHAHTLISEFLLNKIKDTRYEVLHHSSDFNKLYSRIKTAREQATQSVEYWKLRFESSNSPQDLKDLNEAEDLFEIFSKSLGILDRQSENILEYFRRCESKLGNIMDGFDYAFQKQRLQKLRSESAELVSEVETLGPSILSSFLLEIQKVELALEAIKDKNLLQISSELDNSEQLREVARKIINNEPASARIMDELMAPLSMPEQRATN